MARVSRQQWMMIGGILPALVAGLLVFAFAASDPEAGDRSGQSRALVSSGPMALARDVALPQLRGRAATKVTAAAVANGAAIAMDSGRRELLFLTEDEIERVELQTDALGEDPHLSDLELTDTGILLIADAQNGQIWQYALDGRFLGPFFDEEQTAAADLRKPTAIAKDSEGRIVITDAGDHKVKVFDKLGALQGVFGGSGAAPGRLSFPNDVVVGPDGLVYVADSNNRRVQVFEKESGRLVRILSQTETAVGLALPRSLAFDADDRLHVVDTFQERVSVFSIEGEFLFSYGHLGPAEEKLSLPEGITVLEDGVLVGDQGNARLAVFAPGGEGREEQERAG